VPTDEPPTLRRLTVLADCDAGARRRPVASSSLLSSPSYTAQL
jgi:hypothetical protein